MKIQGCLTKCLCRWMVLKVMVVARKYKVREVGVLMIIEQRSVLAFGKGTRTCCAEFSNWVFYQVGISQMILFL